MGCSDTEACLYAGISRSSLYKYQEQHPEYLQQKEEWKENPILLARSTVYRNMRDPNNARWYLERKKKNEFAQTTKNEVSGPDGDSIPIKVHIETVNPALREALGEDVKKD